MNTPTPPLTVVTPRHHRPSPESHRPNGSSPSVARGAASSVSPANLDKRRTGGLSIVARRLTAQMEIQSG
jgi:hypothetical protein